MGTCDNSRKYELNEELKSWACGNLRVIDYGVESNKCRNGQRIELTFHTPCKPDCFPLFLQMLSAHHLLLLWCLKLYFLYSCYWDSSENYSFFNWVLFLLKQSLNKKNFEMWNEMPKFFGALYLKFPWIFWKDFF